MNFSQNFFRSIPLVAAVFATAVLAPAALGAPVPNPAPGDVFAGFRASDGLGASTSYLVKLGTDTSFRSATPGTSFVVTGLGNITADLVANYGANWHTRSDLQWGIFAVRNGVSPVVYGSRGRAVVNTIATAWPLLTSTNRGVVAGAITSVLEEVGGYKGTESTANSAVAILQTNFGGAASYNFQVGTAGTSDFSSVSQWTNIEASFVAGPSGAVLDLFRISSAVSHVGSFSISSAGIITFTAPPPAGNVDTDGDGFSDAAEAAAGTSPTDPNSYFRSSVTPVANGYRVQTPLAAANRTYNIEYSETLAAGSWIVIAQHTSGASAAPVDFTDTNPVRLSKPRSFYRVTITF